MPGRTDTAEQANEESPEVQNPDAERGRFDRRLLSDLFVNVVPIAIIAAFVLMFGLLSPADGGDDSLVLFHGALIGGVVLVSIVAGWVIGGEDSALEGSAASDYDTESGRD